jgi:hypothetical protein
MGLRLLETAVVWRTGNAGRFGLKRRLAPALQNFISQNR